MRLVRKLLIGILSLVILAGCSAESGSTVEGSEFETSMKEVSEILNEGINNNGELNEEDRDRVRQLLYDEDYGIDRSSKDYSLLMAMKTYDLNLTNYSLEMAEQSEVIAAKKEAESYFDK
jgi:hypothetical protein